MLKEAEQVNPPNFKSLFWGGNNTWYTHEAQALDTRIATLLRPIINEYAGYGYSLREIYYVISMAANDETLMKLIDVHQDNCRISSDGRADD